MSFARMRSLAIVTLLAVCALVVVWITVSKDSQSKAADTDSCDAGTVPVSLTFPEAKNVKLRVFNATGQAGLAAQVADDFRNRKFEVSSKLGNEKLYDGVARLRYGPRTVAAAWLLRAYFIDEADDEEFKGFDPKRKDDVVDVIIGTRFRQLGTPTEVNQSIAQLGSPQAPPGTCPTE